MEVEGEDVRGRDKVSAISVVLCHRGLLPWLRSLMPLRTYGLKLSCRFELCCAYTYFYIISDWYQSWKEEGTRR